MRALVGEKQIQSSRIVVRNADALILGSRDFPGPHTTLLNGTAFVVVAEGKEPVGNR